jgi:hypothetical protein
MTSELTGGSGGDSEAWNEFDRYRAGCRPGEPTPVEEGNLGG